jgi:hypothetical protein
MARPTKRTPETAAAIVEFLKTGASRTDAARAAGICHDTFREWAKEDEAFGETVEQAESECANIMAKRLYDEAKKSDGDWRAAMEWLKRRRREDWSERQELTGANGAGIRIIVKYEGHPDNAADATSGATADRF